LVCSCRSDNENAKSRQVAQKEIANNGKTAVFPGSHYPTTNTTFTETAVTGLKLVLLLALVSLGFACASEPGEQGALHESARIDAQATILAYDAAKSAEATAVASQTAVAYMATGDAAVQQTAVSQQATAAAVSTLESLIVQQTAVALQMSVDEATAVAVAQQTAVAVTIAAETAREEQRTQNVIMARTAEREALRSEQVWDAFFNSIMFGIGLAVIFFILMFAVVIAKRINHLNSNPVQHYDDGQRQVSIVVMPSGLFRSEVRQIGNGSENGQPLLSANVTQTAASLPPIRNGHVLIAGETGSGKSTAMRSVLERRQNVTVLDPHAAPGEWGAAKVVGGGGRFADIESFLGTMLGELDRRMEQRGNGRIDFDPMTVATDEMPAIVGRLGGDVGEAWRGWLREGRKFNLSFVVATQSTRVKTLGIQGEGDVLDAFAAVIYLGKQASSKFPDLVTGLDRPAVLRVSNREPYPVVVPNIQPVYIQPETAGDPIVIESDPLPPGEDTEYGFVPQEEVDEIIRWGKRLSSLRAVSQAVYESTGGNGWYKVREILSRYDITPTRKNGAIVDLQ
jgi:hypothetical protein